MRHSMILRALALVGMLSATTQAWGKVDITRNGNVVTYDIGVDDVALTKINLGGKDFVEAKLVGAGKYAGTEFEVGHPEIPVLRFIVEGDVNVDVIPSMVAKETLGPIQLKPGQPSWSKSMQVRPPVAYDVGAYKAIKMLAADAPFSVENAGSVRGRERKLVTLRPFAYQPSNGSYQLLKQFRMTVKEPQLAKDASFVPTIALVIGAKFAANPKIDELAELKQSQGFRVQRLILGQNGLTTDVAIRGALQGLLRDEKVNLRHAILIGDIADVPSHASTIIEGVTDHFYRAIDTDNYETDINGPDIGVGRLSVQTEAQLEIVVNKIVRYSSGKFGRDNWLNHPAFVTTHDRYEVAEATHNSVVTKHFAPRQYDRVFPNANEKGGDKLYPITLHATAAQIVQHMKAGRTIINFSGHGSNTGWEDVTTQDVNSLNDPDVLPYVIGNACITADFRKDSVFGETWLRQPYGAITYWGSMDSSYWDEDDLLEKALYDGLFDKGIRAFDLLHQNALAAVWTYYGGANRSKYYWETYVTFGDPSLEFRPVRAREVTIEGLDSVIVGAPTSSVRIVGAGKGKGNAGVNVVLVRKSDGVMTTARTNEAGEAVLNTGVFAGNAESLELSVSGAQIQSAEKSVPVVAADRPFFGLNNWKVNGRDANGAYVGEQVALSAVAENFGIPTRGGRVVIEEVNGPASATRVGQATIPALANRERAEIGAGLGLVVHKNANRGDTIRVTLRWDSVEGSTGRSTLSLPVIRGDISVVAVDYGNPEVEGIATSGPLFLTIKNTGNEVLRNARLTGVADACTTGVEGELMIAELKAGESIRVPSELYVTTDAACTSGSQGKIRISGQYEGTASTVLLTGTTDYLVGQLHLFHEQLNGMNIDIPDHGDPVVKSFEIKESGQIRDLSIAVNITHGFIADLSVTLKTPTGAVIKLHSNTGGSNDNLVTRWGRNGVLHADLEQLVGQDAKGIWEIGVQDTATTDKGKWNDLDFEIRHW